MFSLIGGIIKYGFISTGVVVGGALLYLNKTKPTKEDFQNSVSRGMTNIQWVDKPILGAATNIDVKDYIFYNVLRVSVVGPQSESKTFIGVFNDWIETDRLNSTLRKLCGQ